MVALTGGANVAVRMDTLELNDEFDGDVTSTSSTQITVDVGGGYTAIFTGTGFTFSGEDVTGGTLTQIEYKLDGNTTYNITGINVPAVDFVQWIQDDATETGLTTIFGGNDNLTGTAFNDWLEGYGAHDNLIGGDGSDTLVGGVGNDHLWGQSASGGDDEGDSLNGGDGSDYIHGNAGNDTIDGGNGSDRIFGGKDDDSIIGGEGNDTVNGNLGNDTIDGGVGNDSLRGGQGDDSVSGGEGNDIIDGDLGDDVIIGGAGHDIMTGSEGSDTFVFASGDAAFSTSGTFAFFTDTITDFTDGEDLLNIGKVIEDVFDAPSTAFTSVQAAYDYAQDEFANADEPEVSAVEAQVGNDTYVFYDADGDLELDSAILLKNFQATNFDTDNLVSVG